MERRQVSNSSSHRTDPLQHPLRSIPTPTFAQPPLLITQTLPPFLPAVPLRAAGLAPAPEPTPSHVYAVLALRNSKPEHSRQNTSKLLVDTRSSPPVAELVNARTKTEQNERQRQLGERGRENILMNGMRKR
jgi:hypothetical protein